MALFKTSNPALSTNAFREQGFAAYGEGMTISGTVNKAGILVICCVATAAVTWNMFLNSRSPEAVMPLGLLGLIGGLIVAIVTIFKKTWAPVTAPLYSLLEGLVLGAASAVLEVRFPGNPVRRTHLWDPRGVAACLSFRCN